LITFALEGNLHAEEVQVTPSINLDGESFLFWLIKWSTIIFILYMGAMYYMNKRRGIEGPEAIPHLEFW
jgi:hypothetical protein